MVVTDHESGFGIATACQRIWIERSKCPMRSAHEYPNPKAALTMSSRLGCAALWTTSGWRVVEGTRFLGAVPMATARHAGQPWPQVVNGFRPFERILEHLLDITRE
jgi:hypothetical protein